MSGIARRRPGPGPLLIAALLALGAALAPRDAHACSPDLGARPAPIAVHAEQAELVARVRIEQVSEREPLFDQSATMTVLEPIKGALTETLVAAGFGDGTASWPRARRYSRPELR